ncbi:MAG: 4-(cytidine 5'-diphospho)-2-C-methyl-D-erythritol kinase [Planctomycetes bacterium RIFCSPHIGHO2_12_FULL_52_36]|nr:MAG: 4-(cytidine 5'-diphospho)-2-C-methyl-D-erythritol kinase [Planctomycetes bacterium RIFCSPHIGHO2_02_FULL_52_58]OHB94069.1 MAG: 4-(cytidine 5'-diphospho)-2-C-methyl-D-erythritol kinase [Planctomycetes bacterium RIFCSPHIGHO2_12_FULL_52_36]
MSTTPKKLRLQSPAKINLFLEILGKRADGYYEIETVMQEIDLADTLEIEESGSTAGDKGIELHCTDTEIPCNEDNLVWKAARLFQEELGISRGLKIRLEKRIPVGAGLGGGSSDAATVLKGLDTLWQTGIGKERLMEMAARLGSDVPFFIQGGTALCSGRGERVGPPLTAGKDLYYTLLYPDIKIPTATIYRNLKIDLTKDRKDVSLLLTVLKSGDPKSLGQLLFNRLEVVAFGLYPKLQEIKTLLESYRPCGVLLSGSGSCIYSLFNTGREAEETRRELKRKGFDKVYVARPHP